MLQNLAFKFKKCITTIFIIAAVAFTCSCASKGERKKTEIINSDIKLNETHNEAVVYVQRYGIPEYGLQTCGVDFYKKALNQSGLSKGFIDIEMFGRSIDEIKELAAIEHMHKEMYGDLMKLAKRYRILGEQIERLEAEIGRFSKYTRTGKRNIKWIENMRYERAQLRKIFSPNDVEDKLKTYEEYTRKWVDDAIENLSGMPRTYQTFLSLRAFETSIMPVGYEMPCSSWYPRGLYNEANSGYATEYKGATYIPSVSVDYTRLTNAIEEVMYESIESDPGPMTKIIDNIYSSDKLSAYHSAFLINHLTERALRRSSVFALYEKKVDIVNNKKQEGKGKYLNVE
ncbi:hypothetical protein OAM69_03445 [bacterium]|nr:hypothetical protein [bacterium]